MEDLDTSLICHETETSLDGHEQGYSGDDKENIGWGSVPALVLKDDDEDEYIENLIKQESARELEASGCQFGHAEGDALCRRARLDSIQWILNARSFLGFHYRTGYLAITYLDRFLAKRSIGDEKLWAVRLLSVACLSLAAKMEECDVPSLSGYPMQKYGFENTVIRRMELLILQTLDWRMGSITPFVFLNFFISKIMKRSSCSHSDVYPDAVELIFAALKEISLVNSRPSTIAAAAVLASSPSALLTRKAVELKTGVIPSWGSKHYEQVVCCYNFMQEIKENVKNKTPKGWLASPSIGAFRNAPSFSSAGVGLKRRIQFINDDDENLPVTKANKQ